MPDKFFRSVLPGEPRELPKIDTSVAHIARVYDYWLGGKDNFAVDREVGQKALQAHPETVLSVQANRRFLARSVRHLAAAEGIRQFLDIGTGLPTADNTHQVAQRIAPGSRIVYADNDPLVLAHAQALLDSAPEGRTAYLHGDLRDPAAIFSHPDTRALLDFSQPIALMLVAILHLTPDEARPAELIAALTDALPPGSYLVASHLTTQHDPAATSAGQQTMREAGMAMQKRDSDVFASLAFSGLDLVPPGVVLASEWRPAGPGPRPLPSEVNCYAGVARKP